MDDSKGDSNPFIDIGRFLEDFGQAHAEMQPDFAALDEFDSIAENDLAPLPDDLTGGVPIQPVGDSTTASILEQKPLQIITRAASGEAMTNNKLVNIVVSHVLKTIILPNCNFQYPLLFKLWDIVRYALRYGLQWGLVMYRSDSHFGGYSGPDFYLPEIRSIYLEPGARSFQESNIIYHTRYYQKSELVRILRNIKEEPESEYGWKPAVLQTMLDNEGQAPDSVEHALQFPETSLIPAANVYQRGAGADFFEIDPLTGDVARRWKNPDPGGRMPVVPMYANTNKRSRLGYGLVEAVLPLQNMLNAAMTGIHYTNLYNLNPASFSSGGEVPGGIRLEAGHNNHSPDPNASFTLLPIETKAVTNFSDNYKLVKSQIIELAQSSSISIGSSIGNERFSQTSPGVKAQVGERQFENNKIRKAYEIWFEETCSLLTSYHFSIGEGKKEVPINRLVRKQIKNTFELDEEQLAKLEGNDTLLINYSEFKDELINIKIDEKSGSPTDDYNDVQSLERLLDSQSPIIQAEADGRALFFAYLQKIGFNNPQDYLKRGEDDGPTLDQQQQALIVDFVERILTDKGIGDPRAKTMKDANIKLRDLPDKAQLQLISEMLGLEVAEEKSPNEVEDNIKKAEVLQKAGAPLEVVAGQLDPGPDSQAADDATRVAQAASSGQLSDEQLSEAIAAGLV